MLGIAALLVHIPLPCSRIRVLIVAGAGATAARRVFLLFHTFPQTVCRLATTLCYYLSVIVRLLFTAATSFGRALLSKFRTQAPWEFLLSASRNTLQSYELSRLAHAANLKKEITALLDQWLQETTAANLARWLIEQRQRAVAAGDDSQGGEAVPCNSNGASDNFLAEHFPSPANFDKGS